MLRSARWLLTGLVMTGLMGFAHAAQPAPTVVQPAPAPVTKVVIAPARDPVAQIIKQRLHDAYYRLSPGASGYDDAQKLYFFYGERGFEPLWLQPAADGGMAFSPNAEKILEVFRNARSEGFDPADYLTPELDLAAAGSDPAKLAAVETAFSASALRYAQHAYGGRVRPLAVDSSLVIAPKRVDQADMLVKLATASDPAKVLRDLDPPGREFQALKAALARIDSGEMPEPVRIEAGPTLRLGMSDPRVPELRKRLSIAADPASEVASDVYDETVRDAVAAFQAEAGIEADGVLGPATRAALNRDAGVTRDDIIANMEYWRWEPHDFGDFYVMVNIPAFRLAVVDGGKTAFTTRVVVGKPSTQTPVFNDRIRDIVVNPYWNVPPSIIAKEIAPDMLRNPGYLDRENMEIVDGGRVIDASAINWSAVNQRNFPFTIRQRPGPGNALGNIKFLFPNQWDVYLHDTPSKYLFDKAMRAFSHGCVRVQNPMEFARALLHYEPDLTVDKLEAMFGPRERWVPLKTSVPVHLTYFTVRVDEDGTIRSYADIYGHNRKLIRLLGGQAGGGGPEQTVAGKANSNAA